MRKWLIFLLLLPVFSGCAPAATPEPTQDVGIIQTEAARVIYETLTQAALLTPSATLTPLPSDTPQPTLTPVPSATLAPVILPTAVPTNTYIPYTLTPTQGPYQCTIVSQNPAYGTKLKTGVDFDFKVTLRNSGTETWTDDNVDFAYLSGTKMQESVNSRDLTSDVSPGSETTFIVDMLAPVDTGTYSAVWALLNSGNSFCTITISIVVTDQSQDEED